MPTLSDLVTQGTTLLQAIQITKGRNYISTDQAIQANSIHTMGRFLLQGIDKSTYQVYCALFSKTVDEVGRIDVWTEYVMAELAKCIGILDAVNHSGKEALDKSLVRVFISHGKFTPAFSKLESFLRALGCLPIYDTAEPTEGRTINQHVEKLFSEADFNIILATGETKNEKGDIFPNHNVMIEYDRLVKDKPDEIIVFLEAGVKMPSMVQDIIYTPFSQECMDDAFTKLVRELARRGLLKS